jgi:peptide/nickel transport system substrate-binding protein
MNGSRKLVGLLIVFAIAMIICLSPDYSGAVDRKRTLVIAQPSDPRYLRPGAGTGMADMNCIEAVMEGLVRLDPKTNKIEPLLAESWKWMTDTTLQFKLRKGVTFSNGEPLDADAAKFGLDLMLDQKIAPGFTRYVEQVKSIEKVDSNTINIHLVHPFPGILWTFYRCALAAPKYWKEVGPEKFNQHPIGTGQFKFVEWVKDDRIVMDKNERYWGKLPQGIDRIIWKSVPDDLARAAGTETGEYDLVLGISVNSVAQIEANPNLQLYTEPNSWRVYQLLLSMLKADPSPIHDRRVRQAINYAVDKNAIVKNLFLGRAKPLPGQVLPDFCFGFNPSLRPYPYDPEKAKKLLIEAGYPNGFEIPFKFPSGAHPQDREVCEAVAGMLSRVGINCKMIVLETGEWLTQLRNRKLGPMSFMGLGPVPEPHIWLSQYRSDWRYSFYQNPEFDKLLDAAKVLPNNKEREKLYHQLTQLMYDDAVIVFLYQGVDFYASTKRLNNWKPSPEQGHISLYGIKLVN